METRMKSEHLKPIIVLLHPQLAENIGMTARAMLNCGLTELRMVKPKVPWPSLVAGYTSAGADDVLDKATLYETTEEALADVHHSYALTARSRDMVKPVTSPRASMDSVKEQVAEGQKVAFVFGGEQSGMSNDDVTLCDTIVTAPLNPDFSSLNLSQAVLMMSYEWLIATQKTSVEELKIKKNTELAEKEEIFGFFGQLEEELDRCGFLRVKEKRPDMVRNIRNIFLRSHLTSQEVRTLRGIVSGLIRLQKEDEK